MFKTFKTFAVIIASALAITIPTQQVSAASVGGSCSRAGILGGTTSNPLICKKVGKKLKWQKASTSTTAPAAVTSSTVAAVATTTTVAAVATTTTVKATTSISAGLVTTNECPTARFPDLSSSTGAGSGYPKPTISVSCTDSVVTVSSNNMIGYPFVAVTPNALRAQNYVWRIARNPAVASSPTLIVKNGIPTMGTLAFTTTGLAIYGPTEAAIPADKPYGDPNYNGLLDTCGGHTGPSAEYHNHVLYTLAACNLNSRAVLGYAIDGFPIYGPTACLNVACTSTGTVRSGYTKIGDPAKNVWSAYSYTASSDALVLDACNGRTQPDGSYGYHAVMSFPYILGCLKGTATVQSGAAAAPMPAMTNNAGQPSDVRASSASPLLSKEGLSVYCVVNSLN
jgi:hypothetical protein